MASPSQVLRVMAAAARPRLVRAAAPVACATPARRAAVTPPMPARRHFAVANTAPTRGTDTVVDVAQKLSRFRDHWSPRIVGQLNDLHVKVAKVEGEFVWHDHPDTDELFYVVAGTLHIEVRDDPAKPEDVRTVAIPAGSFYVVPKGASGWPQGGGTSCSAIPRWGGGTIVR